MATFIPLHFDITLLSFKLQFQQGNNLRGFLSIKQTNSMERDPDSSKNEPLFCVKKVSMLWDWF